MQIQRKFYIKIVLLAFTFLVVLGFFFVKLPADKLVKSTVELIFSKTHSQLSFESAHLSLSGTISFENLHLDLNPFLQVTAEQLDLSPALLPFFLGRLQVSKIKSPNLKIILDKQFSKNWTSSTILDLKNPYAEWLPVLTSQIFLDSLFIQTPEVKFHFSEFESNLNILNQSLKGNLQFEKISCLLCPPVNYFKTDVEISGSSYKLAPQKITLWDQTIDGEVTGDLFGKSTGIFQISKLPLASVGAWFFKNPVHIEGISQSKTEIQFNTKHPLETLRGETQLSIQDLVLENLSLQKEDVLLSHAPDFKSIKAKQIEIHMVGNKQGVHWDKISGYGEQFKLEGKGSSNWENQLLLNLNLVLSKASTESLPKLTRRSLRKNREGQATLDISLAIDPMNQELKNLGSLFLDAVGENLKHVGESFFDLFD